MPTVKNEFKQEIVESAINYQPEVKKEVVNQVVNNDKELIDMDNSEIDNYFDRIEKAMNMKNIVNDSEVKENIQMSVPKEVVPLKIEIKEEIKVDENLSIDKQIFNFFIKDYKNFEHRFENMKVVFDSKNKKAIINFKDEPFNVEWSINNKVDKHYQKAIAFVTKEIFKVEIR